nr:unnamed protein product [Digitaria exilis]
MRASSLFSDDYAACCAPTTAQAAGVADTTVLSDFPASDLTGGHYGFLPRKRARVAAEPGGFFVDQCVPAQGLMPLPVTTTTGDVQSRVGSGAASTSGRVAVHGATLPSYHDDGDEIDALIRLQVRACCDPSTC